MPSKKLLFTAPADACGDLKSLLMEEKERIIHLPLEKFRHSTDNISARLLKDNISAFSFVTYGSLRNAKFFIEWAESIDRLAQLKNLVHFSLDDPTADFLEKQGIPSIKPREKAKPIDILEFMLRISREGKTLYPAVRDRAEEMPGLLEELQMDVAEFVVCEEVGLTSDELDHYRSVISNRQPDYILLHNRSAVTRTGAAFPGLELQKLKVISGSAGVSQILIGKGIEPDFEAEGSWYSIEKVIREEFL